MNNRTNWGPILTSVGIGAAAYQMMNPNNRVSNAVRQRMQRMRQTRQLFPNQ